MVVDATTPSLVLLLTLVTALLGMRLLDAMVSRHRRHALAARRATAVRPLAPVAVLRLPRVVLLDEESWPATRAA